MLSRDAIRERKPKPVSRDIESLGDTVLFKPLGASSRLKVFEAFQKAETLAQQAQVIYTIVYMSAVDESGERLFDSAEDVGEMEEAVATELGVKAMEVNGFNGDAIEAEAKN